MSQRADIMIVGGGVIGLTTAYFLAREGLRVEVVDRADFGQEASWAGAGILPPGSLDQAPAPVDQLRAHSISLFPTLVAELRERTGIDSGYLRCGGLEFLRESSGAAHQEWRGAGTIAETVDEHTALDLEPALATGLGPANYLPEMAQVRNPRHMKALLAGCALLGVRLRPGCPVHGLEHRGPRITALQTVAANLEAEQFLLAAGAWTDALLAPLGWQLGIRPVRGQIALLRTSAPLVRRILLWGSRYLVPRPEGRVLVGSTEEDAGFSKDTTAAAIADLLVLAGRLVPALATASLERCWAGLRPGSPDDLPYLGAVPGWDNLYVAAGHFRAGIQLSPGTALVLTELLLHRPLTVALEPFRLDRQTPPSLPGRQRA
jgi:glycine oxidase